MSEIAIEWLVKILLPLGAIALIIGVLIIPDTVLVKLLQPLALYILIIQGVRAIFDPESMFEESYKLKLSQLEKLLTRLAGIILTFCSTLGLIVMLRR